MAEAKSKDSSSWLPFLLGGGLIVGGALWWMTSKSANGEEPIKDDTLAIIDNAADLWKEIDEYLALIYADGRTPSDAELEVAKARIDLAIAVENAIEAAQAAAAAKAAQAKWRDIGYYVICPPVTGFIFAAGLWAVMKVRKPPKNPPTCPGCGATASTPESIVNHAQVDHMVTENPTQLAMANGYWQQQLNFTKLTVATYGQVYGLAYSNLSPTWGSNNLQNFMASMCGAYAAEIGTASTLAALQQCAQYAMILA